MAVFLRAWGASKNLEQRSGVIGPASGTQMGKWRETSGRWKRKSREAPQEAVFSGVVGQLAGRLAWLEAGGETAVGWVARVPVAAAWEKARTGEQRLGRREKGGRFGEGCVWGGVKQ